MADPVNREQTPQEAQGGNLVIDMGRRRRVEFAKDLPAIGTEGALPRAFGADPDQGGRSQDAGTDYLVQRAQADSDALERRAREKYGVAAPAPVASSPGAVEPLPSAPASSPPSPGGDAGGGAAPDAQASPFTGRKPGEPTLIEDLKNVAAATPDALRKVGGELVRAPRAVAAGVTEAGREMAGAVDSLAEWLNTNVADLKVPVGKTGSDTIDAFLANPAKAIEAAIPHPDTPDNVTGPMLKSVAQFLTGMVAGGKLLKAAGATLKGGKMALASGAFSDALAFDPNEANLAALLNNVPALKHPVTEFMATDPRDNEAVNRLKKAVEGMGLGLATDGLIKAISVYRAARAARQPAGETGQAAAYAEAKAKYGQLSEADLFEKLGGNPAAEAKLVEFNAKGGPTAEQLAAAADDPAKLAALKAEHKPAAGDLAGGRIAINWARIESGDDAKVVLREMADHFRKEIKSARRGKMAETEIRHLADELGMTVDDLLARRQGQALNAEETLAARQLLTQATDKLLELARAAAQPNAGPVDVFAFRRMLATQAAIQSEVLAARAEAGRALAAWKIPAAAKGDVERSRAVIEALDAGGGEDMARDLARRISLLADSGVDAAGINAVARQSATATAWQAVSEVWVNALLSSPKTHLVNIASNTVALGQQILERGIAEKVSNLFRLEGGAVAGVAPGEAAAMMQGLIMAQRDAWKMGWLALRSGETGRSIGKVDAVHSAAVTAENFRLEGSQLGRAVDFIGTVERVPGRLLGAEDEFFKTIGYRMELYAQAQRQATAEGLSGADLRKRFAEIVANPPENIRLASVDAALYTTFTSVAGDGAKALIRLREAWPATVFILPFVKTPINILKYSFERTPVAPLMSSFKADVAAGGARAELALARMATGTSIMLMAADYADRGLVSGKGPADPKKREALMRQGWQPYSVFVDDGKGGGKWVSYDRADPYGMLMGFAADMAELAARFDIEGDKLDEFQEIWSAGIAAVSQTTINKTYLQGLSDFMWMVEDPQRRAFDYAGKLAGSTVPAGVNVLKQLSDPVAREHMKLWDYVQGRLPGFAADLTPARDLWGRERQPDPANGVVFNALSPAQVSAAKPSPVDAEMTRLNMGVERIDKRAFVEGVAMNFRDWPQVYDRYVVLAGNALKNPAYGNMGAMDFLNATIEGKGPLAGLYARMGEGPEGGKADFIRATVSQYRKQAQAAILADPAFKDFQAAWRDARDQQAAAKARLEGQPQVRTPDIARPMPPGAPPMGAPPVSTPPATSSPMRAQ